MKGKRKNKRADNLSALTFDASPPVAPRRTFPTREKLKEFAGKTILSAFFLTIGIVLPGCSFAKYLYTLGIQPFDPTFPDVIILALCCIAPGALVALLGIFENRFFIPLMMNLCVYGLLLPTVIGAMFAVVIHYIIAPLLGFDSAPVISVIFVVLFVSSVGYGIFSTIQMVLEIDRNVSQTAYLKSYFPNFTTTAPVVDALLSDLDLNFDSDCGSSDGGDGGGN